MVGKRWIAVVASVMLLTASASTATARPSPTISASTDANDTKGFLDVASARVIASRDTFTVHIKTYDPFRRKSLIDCAAASMFLPDTERLIKVGSSNNHWVAILIDETGGSGIVARARIHHPFPRRLVFAFPASTMGPAKGVSKWLLNTASKSTDCRDHWHGDDLPERGFIAP